MKLLVIATAVLFGSASPIFAFDQLTSPWIVQSTNPPNEVQVLMPGDYVTRSSLLPLGLAEVDQDVVSAKNGELLLQAGAQVCRVNEGRFFTPRNTFPGVVYCSVDEVRQIKRLLSGSIGARVCLFDAEEDQRFDGWFWKSCDAAGLPDVRGSVPKRKSPLRPTSYTVLDPEEIIDPPFIGIRYVRRTLGGGFRFEPAFGRQDKSGVLPAVENIGNNNLPKTGELLGARFTVISYAGDEIKVHVLQTMPAGLMGLQHGGTCGAS